MQSLKSEFCKHLGEKSSFDAKVTLCYFGISSLELRHFYCYSVQNVISWLLISDKIDKGRYFARRNINLRRFCGTKCVTFTAYYVMFIA